MVSELLVGVGRRRDEVDASLLVDRELRVDKRRLYLPRFLQCPSVFTFSSFWVDRWNRRYCWLYDQCGRRSVFAVVGVSNWRCWCPRCEVWRLMARPILHWLYLFRDFFEWSVAACPALMDSGCCSYGSA